ncbi:hypothetical protein EsH8_IV_000795 [Colletotrichum jinshuiense]
MKPSLFLALVAPLAPSVLCVNLGQPDKNAPATPTAVVDEINTADLEQHQLPNVELLALLTCPPLPPGKPRKPTARVRYDKTGPRGCFLDGSSVPARANIGDNAHRLRQSVDWACRNLPATMAPGDKWENRGGNGRAGLGRPWIFAVRWVDGCLADGLGRGAAAQRVDPMDPRAPPGRPNPEMSRPCWSIFENNLLSCIADDRKRIGKNILPFSRPRALLRLGPPLKPPTLTSPHTGRYGGGGWLQVGCLNYTSHFDLEILKSLPNYCDRHVPNCWKKK